MIPTAPPVDTDYLQRNPSWSATTRERVINEIENLRRRVKEMQHSSGTDTIEGIRGVVAARMEEVAGEIAALEERLEDLVTQRTALAAAIAALGGDGCDVAAAPPRNDKPGGGPKPKTTPPTSPAKPIKKKSLPAPVLRREVLALLEGDKETTAAELVRRLADRAADANVRYVLNTLVDSGQIIRIVRPGGAVLYRLVREVAA